MITIFNFLGGGNPRTPERWGSGGLPRPEKKIDFKNSIYSIRYKWKNQKLLNHFIIISLKY